MVAESPKWNVAGGSLTTRWAKDVSPEKVHPEYPRPTMVREEWLNLNGLWEVDFARKNEAPPFGKSLSKTILIPFPVESALSGVKEHSERLWYRKIFEIPSSWKGKRIFLHFGTVDWETTVFVNERNTGTHRGGYDGFSFDITELLDPAGKQELLIGVCDPTDRGKQPRGKQVVQPKGIWYTSTTGIWQTVWLEPVPETGIRSLKIIPDVDREEIRVSVRTLKAGNIQLETTVRDSGKTVSRRSSGNSGELKIPVPNAKLWSPDQPFLYDLEISLYANGEKTDTVKSYFGMRKIALGKDSAGKMRLMLNNQPLFQFGPLDQGFWPDGIYTAPTDEALRFDIEMTKEFGFNMIRKHVKIEPERWYYWCDKLGLLVWQDMPNGGEHVKKGEGEFRRSESTASQFEFELQQMMDGRFNHPSIVCWVIFNEGWGQFDTARLVKWAHEHDPSRLINSASGWNDMEVGDMHDIHAYPGPEAPPLEPGRAIVLGEFGGLGLPVPGHLWQDKENWGYRSFADQTSLTAAYTELIKKLKLLVQENGLSAAVYTQTTDVEIEVNGLMSYDREIVKIDVEQLRKLSKLLIELE